MKIAVDLDGVIWDIMISFVNIYNEEYDKSLHVYDVNKWAFFTDEEFNNVYPKTLEKIDEYPAIDDNICHYLFLLNGKHDVKILTHEANPVRVLKKKLESFGIREGFEYLELIKQDFKEHPKKTDIKFDVYIDDCPLMIDDIKNYPDRILLLFEQPWNRDCEETSNVIRVKGWKDVMKKIKELENVL